MPRTLPERPDIDYLSHQAKKLHHALKRGDPSVCDTLRLLRRFHRTPDHEILASEVKLHEIQFAIAMDYGFCSWNMLSRHIDSIRNSIPATLSRMGDSVQIGGISRLQWGMGQQNTYMASFAAAMRAIGEDVDYDFLMGASGMAFRLHFHMPYGCPSSPDAMVGFDGTIPAAEAAGYSLSFRHVSEDRLDEVAQVRETIVRSIDAGRPVVAIDLIRVPDWGLICGYTNNGDNFLCRTYWDQSADLSVAEKWPWETVFIGDKHGSPSRREVVRKSLEIANKVATTKSFGDYASGFHAYDCWGEYLHDEPHFQSLDPDFGGHTHINAWIYSSLLDARAAASRYLQSVKNDLGEMARDHLLRAAEIYECEVSELKNGLRNAPFPWQLKEGEQWNAEMRQAESHTLDTVAVLEKKAMDELTAALTAERAERNI